MKELFLILFKELKYYSIKYIGLNNIKKETGKKRLNMENP